MLVHITYVFDRSDTNNDPDVVFFFVTVSFLLHFPPLYTGHSIKISAQNCYVIRSSTSAMIIITCLLTISCNNTVLTIIPALYAGSVDHVRK